MMEKPPAKGQRLDRYLRYGYNKNKEALSTDG